MARKARRQYETPEYAAAVRRMIAAHGRRVADADPEDLAELMAMRQVLDDAIAAAVAGQRAQHGLSWTQIAAGAGMTRQGAHQRWSGGAA